jgi:flotillin
MAMAIKERDVKRAFYDGEVEKARADKEISFNLQNTMRSKELESEKVQVLIVKAMKEGELRAQEILLAAQRQEADIVVPARKKAEAMAAEADGEKRQISAIAEGHAAEIRALASAEAEKIRLIGQAESERILKVGQAEAEAMRLKAEAYSKYGDAAKLDILARIMPEMTESMAKSLQNTEKIIVITSGNGGSNDLPNMIAQGVATIPMLVKGLTGQSVSELIRDTADAVRGPAASFSAAAALKVNKEPKDDGPQ